MKIIRDLLLAIAIMGCGSPVKRGAAEPLQDARWCAIATVKYQRGWVPFQGCMERRITCEWARRQAKRSGHWIGIRSVSECFEVAE